MALVDPGNTGRDGFIEHLNLQVRNDKEVRGVLRETDKLVQLEITKIPGDSVSQQARIAQYRQVSDSIDRHTNSGWSEIGRVIDGNIGRSAAIAGDGAADLVAALGGTLPNELVQGMQAAADTSGQRVAARIANEIDLSPRIYDNAALTNGQISKLINTAIGSNMSAKELARSVSQYISPNAPGGMSYCAMRLGRTELNNAFHHTNREMYKSQPWVEGVKWLLSGSHPKPDICNEFADKEIWTPRDVPSKPHPQCLCYTVPVGPTREQFQNNLLNGDYDDWLETNGMAPISGDQVMMERIYKVTAEDMIKAREQGKSWAVIAKEFDLGSPGSARTAWTKLTGTPHTTAPSAARTTATKVVTKAPTPKPTPTPTPPRSQPVWTSKGPTRPPVEKAVPKPRAARSTGKHLDDWVDQDTIKGVQDELMKIMEQTESVHKFANTIHPRFTADFTGMDLKVANRVAKETRDFVDQYPAVRKKFTGIKIENPGQRGGSQTWMASADPRDGFVRLNKKYWADIQESAIKDRQSRMARSGFKTTGDAYHTINHELGHMVDYAADARDHVDRAYQVKSALVKNTDVPTEMANRFSWSHGEFSHDLSTKNIIGHKVSTYGATNSYELVAEAFADVRINGAAARAISKDVVDGIYGLAKQKGRRR